MRGSVGARESGSRWSMR
ncbi:hypothetical protein E2C01_084048 [Portunus trituberculatus]|uniref:Uncharacterized protein n=1 Tax=Portunus trituberculatus TaxID=210409 RepID=A0A5B7J597_PORTR|nr:hypothetical protein [Portunus trituberculatus]